MSTTSSTSPVALLADVDAAQARLIMRGVTSAVRGDGALTPTQTAVLTVVGTHLLGVDESPAEIAPLGPAALADALPDERQGRGVVHAMVTLEVLAQPVDPAVTARVEQYAGALHVDEGMLAVARDYGRQAMDVAAGDLIRNLYPTDYVARHAGELTLHETIAPTGPTDVPVDTGLAATWRQLATCRSGSLGRTVWDFYQSRGFSIPGTPGAVSPLLAQHDFVHCLADYGTSAMGEIEVFTLIASAIPDPKGFSYLVAILGLFETGYVRLVPGVATSNPGHLAHPGAAIRFADALRRGLALHIDPLGGVDWFAHADTRIDDVRRCFGINPKSSDAIAAGSLGTFDPDAVFGHDQV